VNSIVACYRNAKLCAHAARDFRSQHKPARCHLTDKRFEALMFINYNNAFKRSLFLFNKCLKCLL